MAKKLKQPNDTDSSSQAVRKVGRPKTVSEDDKKVQANVKLPFWVNQALQRLVPNATDRNNLFAAWARAYVIANGESDRLLAQSPLAAKLLSYLEVTNAPEHLRDPLEALLVARESDEVRLDGATQVGDSYIIGK